VLIQAPLVNFSFTGVIFTITPALRRHGTSTVVIGLVQAAVALAGAADRRLARPACAGPMRDGAFAATMAIVAALCPILPGLRNVP
jgi:hypothetical protein